MGIRADLQYCGQYQQASHPSHVQPASPKRAANPPTAERKGAEPSSGGSTVFPQRNQIPFTAANLRLHEDRPSADTSEEVKATAEQLERAAQDLEIDMPPGWRVGGLDGYGRLPLDRWLGGSEGVPGYSRRT